MFSRHLAIIGGLGPHAGAYALANLFQMARREFGAYEDHQYPEVTLYSLPFTGSDARGIFRPAQIKEQLARALEKVERMGAETALIACNSSHVFIDELRAGSHVQLVSLVEAAAREVARSAGHFVTVLGSESTRASGIYGRAISAVGKHYVELCDEDQACVNEIIAQAMTGELTERLHAGSLALIERVKARGAGEILLGCTELSWLARGINPPVELHDSLDCATREMLQTSYLAPTSLASD